MSTETENYFEDRLHAKGGVNADIADALHWAREWCKQDSLMRGEDGQAYVYHMNQAWQAQVYLRAALQQLDKHTLDTNPTKVV